MKKSNSRNLRKKKKSDAGRHSSKLRIEKKIELSRGSLVKSSKDIDRGRHPISQLRELHHSHINKTGNVSNYDMTNTSNEIEIVNPLAHNYQNSTIRNLCMASNSKNSDSRKNFINNNFGASKIHSNTNSKRQNIMKNQRVELSKQNETRTKIKDFKKNIRNNNSINMNASNSMINTVSRNNAIHSAKNCALVNTKNYSFNNSTTNMNNLSMFNNSANNLNQIANKHIFFKQNPLEIYGENNTNNHNVS